MILAKSCDILTGWWLSWWYVSLQYFIANFFLITNKVSNFQPFLFFNTGVLLLRVTELGVDHAYFIGIYGVLTGGVLILVLCSQLFTATGALPSTILPRPYATCFA